MIKQDDVSSANHIINMFIPFVTDLRKLNNGKE